MNSPWCSGRDPLRGEGRPQPRPSRGEPSPHDAPKPAERHCPSSRSLRVSTDWRSTDPSPVRCAAVVSSPCPGVCPCPQPPALPIRGSDVAPSPPKQPRPKNQLDPSAQPYRSPKPRPPWPHGSHWISKPWRRPTHAVRPRVPTDPRRGRPKPPDKHSRTMVLRTGRESVSRRQDSPPGSPSSTHPLVGPPVAYQSPRTYLMTPPRPGLEDAMAGVRDPRFHRTLVTTPHSGSYCSRL